MSAFSDSVGTFRRHLNVLERTTPGTIRRASRARESFPSFVPTPVRSRPALGAPTLSRQTQSRPVPGRVAPVGVARRVASGSTESAYRRRQAQKRRRDVFFALLAGAIGSFLVAVAGVSVLWPVQALFDVLLVSYCALLVRMRNAVAERELKLQFMPAVPAMAVAGMPSTAGRTMAGTAGIAGRMVSGMAALPTDRRALRPARPAYDLAAGYGDLELRRTAH